jgi:hypothetical protein
MKISLNVSGRLVLFLLVVAVITGAYFYAPDKAVLIVPMLMNLVLLYGSK